MATHSSILAWKNPMDRGAWQSTVHGVAKSRTRLSDLTLFLSFCFKYSEWFLFSWKILRNTHLYFFWLLAPSQKSGQRKRGCQQAHDSLQTETKRLSRSMGLADKLWFNRFPPLSQEKSSINHRCRQEL